MSVTAGGEPRLLASFAVASEPGNERQAMARVVAALEGRGVSARRLERLQTAVAEAVMNAIEHGNHKRAEVPVEVDVTEAGGDIVVAITDQGGADVEAGRDTEPDLALKLAGGEDPRGWGLFLIRHMVDAMEVTTCGARHTVRLIVRAVPGGNWPAGPRGGRSAAARRSGGGRGWHESHM